MSDKLLYALARPLLFSLDRRSGAQPDPARAASRRRARPDRRRSGKPRPDPRTVMGITFPNPVGLAAGLDKDGAYIDGLAALGFGSIEIGTVTPRAPGRQPEAAHVPPAARARHHQPHGLQQRRRRRVRGQCAGVALLPEQGRRARPEHRQERRHADRARCRRLPAMPAQGVPVRQLRDGQHLVAEHQEPAPAAGRVRTRRPAVAAQARADAPGRPARPLRAADAQDRPGRRRRPDHATSPTPCCATRSTASSPPTPRSTGAMSKA